MYNQNNNKFVTMDDVIKDHLIILTSCAFGYSIYHVLNYISGCIIRRFFPNRDDDGYINEWSLESDHESDSEPTSKPVREIESSDEWYEESLFNSESDQDDMTDEDYIEKNMYVRKLRKRRKMSSD